MKKAINISAVLIIILFAFIIIIKPEICLKSALSGVLLCGNVIIPSIYPFGFCVLFLNNSGILNYMNKTDKITKKLFGLNYYEFSIFLISLIGGYPMGAKILASEKEEKSNLMIYYCINAGPGFIILAVGKGVFKSITLGWILFFSHIFSSLIIMLILSNKAKKQVIVTKRKTPLSTIDNFVTSASDAADTVIRICGMVILFSCVGGYIKYFSFYYKPLKILSLLCEVTNAVCDCKNVITASFLLGFAGLSIWAQVFTLLKSTKLNYLLFALFRILHGAFSAFITYLLIKTLNISVATLSNGTSFQIKSFINGPAVAFSLIIMGIVLIISLYTKKYAGNLKEDIV